LAIWAAEICRIGWILSHGNGEGISSLSVVAQFGGARLPTSRLARTLAPPKLQTEPLPRFL